MRRLARMILGPFLTGCYRFGTVITFLLTGKLPDECAALGGAPFDGHGYEDVRDFGLGRAWFIQPSLVLAVVQTGRRSQASDRHVRF